jgi:hypothetical protein
VKWVDRSGAPFDCGHSYVRSNGAQRRSTARDHTEEHAPPMLSYRGRMLDGVRVCARTRILLSSLLFVRVVCDVLLVVRHDRGSLEVSVASPLRSRRMGARVKGDCRTPERARGRTTEATHNRANHHHARAHVRTHDTIACMWTRAESVHARTGAGRSRTRVRRADSLFTPSRSFDWHSRARSTHTSDEHAFGLLRDTSTLYSHQSSSSLPRALRSCRCSVAPRSPTRPSASSHDSTRRASPRTRATRLIEQVHARALPSASSAAVSRWRSRLQSPRWRRPARCSQ